MPGHRDQMCKARGVLAGVGHTCREPGARHHGPGLGTRRVGLGTDAWTSVDQRRQPRGSGKGNPDLPAALKGQVGWVPGEAMDWAAWVRVLAGCCVVSSK